LRLACSESVPYTEVQKVSRFRRKPSMISGTGKDLDVARVLSSLWITEHWPDSTRADLVPEVRVLVFKVGQEITARGEENPAGALLVVANGSASVWRRNMHGADERIIDVHVGEAHRTSHTAPCA
jgi:hypothetical protein